ncbi:MULTISPECIES: hypothetical protein [unclassified Microcoleus]
MTGDRAGFKDFSLRGRWGETGGRQAGDRRGEVRSSHILQHSQ